MNSFTKICLLLFVTLLTGNLSAQDCKATLKNTSDINNVIILVDDSLAGTGDYVEVKLGKGTHKITALENSDRWDAKTFIDTITVIDCSDVSINYKFIKKVFLDTDPQDAYVYSADSLIGYTPLLIPEYLNNLRLEKPGYQGITLNYSQLKMNEPVKLKYIGQPDDGNFFDKTLFKILVGSMVTLGAATAYFKLKADNKFDEYQQSGDASLHDQTNRLDLVSGITFVALQINFGLIIYFFLVD